MIILITGASHTGKTVLANRLIGKYHYQCFSIDHLKMGLIRSHQTELTVYDDDKLTLYLWPIVSEMIKTAIENQQNLIVEGCYVPFDWKTSFDDDYLKHIRFIALAMSEDYIDSHWDDIMKHADDVEARLEDDITVMHIKQENNAMITGFSEANEPVVLIEKDYESAIDSIMNELGDDIDDTHN